MLSFYKRGGGETPSEQGLCRESASDFGTFHPQKFPSWWFVLGFGLYFCLFFGLEESIFTVHIIGQQKREPRSGGRWTYAFAGFSFSLGLWGGKWFLEVRDGPYGRKKCLFGDRGTREFHRLSCNLLLDTALPEEPALRPQDHTPASVFPSTGAKNHKGKEENLYIYNIKSLGD